jgi:hypothetical protein
MSSETLEDLLAAARAEPRSSRIEHRDRLAAHGAAAITAVASWLWESELAAFAVRVIGRVGETNPAAAIEALTAARPKASGVLKADIDDALRALGWKPPSTPAKPAPPVEIREDLYEQLVDTARAGKTITYTEAGATIGLTMRNPHHRRLLGQHLGVISERETRHGRPMLSAVVVQKGEKRTGTGFAQLGEDLGVKRAVEDDRTFDVRELDRVFAYWRGRSQRASSATGAPDYRSREPGDEPPPALGACDFGTELGQCRNPGRWDRDGNLSCTTHARASHAEPFRS